jgi:hypothetical protein
MATDLQSAPFGHLGTCPKYLAHDTTHYIKRSIMIVFFIRMMKKDEQAGPHTAPHSLINKDERGELGTQP